MFLPARAGVLEYVIYGKLAICHYQGKIFFIIFFDVRIGDVSGVKQCDYYFMAPVFRRFPGAVLM
jgi:hypothetical protein